MGVVFGEHSNITNLGDAAFGGCFALKSITLPDKLEVIERVAFVACTSLERVVCNKKLKIMGNGALKDCPKLKDVQLASSSISFGGDPFNNCNRMIELAAAAGFPSTIGTNSRGDSFDRGEGVVPYLLNLFERSERKRFVLLALMRFKNAVHTHDGTEEEKVAAAQQRHPRPASMPHPTCFTCEAKRRPTRMLRLCAGCNKTWFCNRLCQIDG